MVRAKVTGQVLKVKPFTTPKGTEGHEVTLLQAPTGDAGEPVLVRVACWNGQVKGLEVGKNASLEVVVRLQQRRDPQGKPYPPRLTVDAF